MHLQNAVTIAPEPQFLDRTAAAIADSEVWMQR
jgi:hypothetical protein